VFRFDTVIGKKVRLNIEKAKAQAVLTEVGVYNERR